MASGIGGIGANKIIEGVASPQDISIIVYNNIFIVHPSLAGPGCQKVHFVINFDFHIGVAGKGVKELIGFHAYQPGKAVH